MQTKLHHFLNITHVRFVLLSALFSSLISFEAAAQYAPKAMGAPAYIQFAAGEYSAVRGQSKVVLVVTRTVELRYPVSVQFRTVDGTAVAGQDFIEKTGSVDFKAGEMEKQIEIDLLPGANQGQKGFSVELFAPTAPGFVTRGHATVTVGLMPKLAIRPMGNGVVRVSWPQMDGYVLEGNENAAAPQWTRLTEPVETINGESSVLVHCPCAVKLFRLVKE